jgi:GR25 family glycosyltransferase involved in LPS biosynthesis
MNNIFTFINQIIYINSLLYPDRLLNLKNQLKKIDVDINDFRCKKIEALYPTKEQIPPIFRGTYGHYGCIYSHSMAYKHISDHLDNKGYSLILEDDILIDNNFFTHYNNMMRDIEYPFDIFYLHNIHNNTIPIKEFSSGLLKSAKLPKLTHAYIINNNLNLYNNYFKDIPSLLNKCSCRHHIDIILRDYICFKNIYTSKYSIIKQNRKQFKSHIKNSKKIL